LIINYKNNNKNNKKMRILKSHPLLKLINSYTIDSPQPANISYLWNFGSLLALCLIIQIITGVTLAMHYNPSVIDAFNSVEHIMRDVNNGWLIRYLHSNTASAFFFLVYLHIGRGLYYGSYRTPRILVWVTGTIIFILMMATAFLGYVLPYGQMSLWGATVITNLMSAIPWVGHDIVEFIWGGFSVNNATLNRFFSLHFVLPFVLAALALIHLIVLHDTAGSSNPLGVSGNYDRLPFAPYFIFKDLITIFIFFMVLSLFVFFMPNVLGDSENYVMANPMQTPPAIVPEWYLLPFYAILRSIPNKLLGVIAMFSAILILLAMPFTDLSRNRGIQFRPLSKITFYIFVANFLVLMVLGAKHVESPFIELGQISTIIYFAHFLVIVPSVSLLENSLTELASYNSSKTTTLSGLNFKPSSVLHMPMLETAVATGATATALSAAGAIKSLVPFVFALAVVVINVFYLVDFSGAELLALNELVNELKSLHEVAYGEYDRLAALVDLYERTNNPLLNETEAKFQEHLNLIKQIVSLIRKVEILIEPLDPGYEPFCAQWWEED
jgi:ubiquinol-cytochrome c reductase cytochrome b subunit